MIDENVMMFIIVIFFGCFVVSKTLYDHRKYRNYIKKTSDEARHWSQRWEEYEANLHSSEEVKHGSS